MNNSNYEDYFLADIYIRPSLVKQIVIPIEALSDGLNRFILQSFIYSYKKSEDINLPTLLMENDDKFKNCYSKEDYMERITGFLDLSDVADIKNFNYYQELLFNEYKERLLKESINKFEKGKMTQEEFLNDMHSIENKSIKMENGKKTIEEIKELVTTNNKVIPFKLQRLSSRAKLQEHDFLIISARTGVGKSGFALNLLEDLSKKYKCVLFNMEMSEPSVYKRLISIMTRIPMDMLSKPDTDYQRKVINEACEELNRRNIKIYSQGQTIQSMRRTIINEQREGHTIVFIDYVGLIGSTEKHKSLYELVTSVVKELRSISMSYDCTIVLLAQINRSGEEKPKLSDLKESGELEQSATQVMILSGEETNEVEQEITLTLAKHRDGRKGEIQLIYNRSNQTFREK